MACGWRRVPRRAPVTLLLALASTAGRVVVPLAVQQTIDHGLSGTHPDLNLVRWACALAGLAVAVTPSPTT